MIAEAIRQARRSAALTQSALAARSGTSQTALSAYENGARTPATATLLRILAAAGWTLQPVAGRRPVHTPDRAELERRGRILREVIELAGAIPGRRRGRLEYPALASPAGARR